MSGPLKISLGVKSDPIQYRYSFDWLFELMAEEGVHHVQMGSFFEMYQLPDEWFVGLRARAEQHGVQISSLFTAHRELGGFLFGEPHWDELAQRNYRRLIEVGALMGAERVGSSMGGVPRDQPERKEEGIARYLEHMKEMMPYAKAKGLTWLTIEPMSCLGEPPTTLEEIRHVAEELLAYHQSHADTVPVGYCTDTSHGWADAEEQRQVSNLEALESTFPYLAELHLKNTDPIFNATFGFNEEERKRGIVDLVEIRELLLRNAAIIPQKELVAYLELSGPKLGRDYSDCKLEGALRSSLRHLKEVFGECG